MFLERISLTLPRKLDLADLPRNQNSVEVVSPIKGVFWNSGGLADLTKHRHLADVVKEKQINFLALIETGRDEFPNLTLKKLCCDRDFIWHSMPPHGRSGGSY